jgi:hypothetical protein
MLAFVIVTCGSFSSSSMGALTDAVSMERTLAVSQVAAVGLGMPDLKKKVFHILTSLIFQHYNKQS